VGPDLAVSPYALWATSFPDRHVVLTATVSNVGSVAAPSAAVAFYVDTPFSPTTTVATSTLPALQPGASATITATWTAPDAASHIFYVAVDPTQMVTETTTANNLASGQSVTLGTLTALSKPLRAGQGPSPCPLLDLAAVLPAVCMPTP